MIGKLLLNRYELLEKIGEGGMGIVYKSKCTLLNRFVAVKILKSEPSDYENIIARFKREAHSIAKLSCPNIINIYDIGSDNNINFIVMEYINGKTLKQVIKDNTRLCPLKSLDISLQIANAVEFAHKNNIIHRDIKPDNILITEDNIVKLTDFGIAKVTDSATITNSNKIIGSIHYFSPEQAKGKIVDCRTDIYSLGVVMYEMLTGKVPFNAEISIAIAMMHIQDPVIPPREVITDIPENINMVVLKALEKEPINRFQTAAELAKILNAIKENPILEINFNNKLMYDATLTMMNPDATLSYTEIDSTLIINEEMLQENIILKNNRKKLLANNISKNRKIMLTIGLIILTIIISFLGNYLSKLTNTDTKSTIPETTVKEESVTAPPSEENRLVPSLIENTQDAAEITIVNNGFLIGNITYEYSDTVPNGLIISQYPEVGTLYEKNKQIDLVISQGQKIAQFVPQISEGEKAKDHNNKSEHGKANGKEKNKKKP